MLFTLAAIVGYRRFREGKPRQAAAWLAVYSASGFISILHYTDISVDDLDVFQNSLVFLDIALATVILSFAVWVAWRGPPTRKDFLPMPDG